MSCILGFASFLHAKDLLRTKFFFPADIHARTCRENQTPMHYAAKNDAVISLKMLMKLNAEPNSRDFKQRTPLQVAAELGNCIICQPMFSRFEVAIANIS